MEPKQLIKQAPGAVKAAVLEDQTKRRVTNRENVGHVAVEAHGATNIEHTKEQHTRKHEQAGSKMRVMKKSSATLGRHVS